MMHKAWSSIEEVPYCFARSSIKFHGHTGRKIDDLNNVDNHRHMFRLSYSKMNLEFPSGQPLVSSPIQFHFLYGMNMIQWVNTLRPEQFGWQFAKNIFQYIFLNKNWLMLMEILLRFLPYDPINSKSAVVQVMAWHRTGDKPIPEPMMT